MFAGILHRPTMSRLAQLPGKLRCGNETLHSEGEHEGHAACTRPATAVREHYEGNHQLVATIVIFYNFLSSSLP